MRLAELDPELLKYATPAEVKQINQALKLEIALASPLDYACYVSKKSQRYAHIIYLNEMLTALIEHRLYKNGPGLPGVVDDLGEWRHPLTGELVVLKMSVSMPPRHGKSYLISDHLPAWFLTKYPDKRVILTSYSDEIAASWGLKARRHVQEHPEFGVLLDPSSHSGSRWDLDKREGGLVTAGAGGPITSKGYHLGIIDDPTKNAEEARSKLIRQGQIDWFDSTFWSRREPDAVTLIVSTRWHEEDLTGQVTSDGTWFVVNMPALAYPDMDEEGISIDIENGGLRDPINRRPGEPLCPERYNVPSLTELRDSPRSGGQVWFQALYQGRPSLDDGGRFSRSDFRYYTRHDQTYVLAGENGFDYIPVKDCYRFMTVDLAASTKTSADFTVFSCWDAAPGGRLILVDRIRDRMESENHSDELMKFIGKMQADGRKVRFVGVEKATYGLSLIQRMVRKGGVILRPLIPDKDKFSRAIPASYAVQAHTVFFPKEASWLPEWEYELVKFGSTTHDDQVDTLAYAVEVWQTINVEPRSVKNVPTTPDELNAERLRAMDRPKNRRGRHPELGRW